MQMVTLRNAECSAAVRRQSSRTLIYLPKRGERRRLAVLTPPKQHNFSVLFTVGTVGVTTVSSVTHSSTILKVHLKVT